MVVGLIIGVVSGLCAGLAIGLFAGRLVRSSSSGSDQAGAAALAEARIENARLAERLTAQQLSSEQGTAAWAEAREMVLGELTAYSERALRATSQELAALAEARLQEARRAVNGEMVQRHEMLEQLLDPLRDQLHRYESHVSELERRREGAYQGLLARVEQLGVGQQELTREARNLSTALRSPTVRGRWGELQLRKVVEMAGMLEHCDFDVQVSTGGDTGLLRPDLVVHLPGSKHVVVDAKVPLDAFQSASSCEDADARQQHFRRHARQLRAHVDALSKKEYWRQLDPSPEFVVAFVPGDPLLAAAYEHDPGLIEHAVAKHVLLATPTTLISLLWAVAYGWQQDALAENARIVQKTGAELYRRLSTLGDHLSKLGRSLGSAVGAYNDTLGSLETRVLVTARRFSELGVAGPAAAGLDEPAPVSVAPRPVQATELVRGSESAEVPGPLAG